MFSSNKVEISISFSRREWLDLYEMDEREKRRALSTIAFAYKELWKTLDFQRVNVVVADIGCGPGFTLDMLTRAFPHVYFIGIDLDLSALYLAKRKVANRYADFIHADAVNLPLRRDSIDIVLAFEIIEHIDLSNAKRLLRTLRNVVRRVILMSTPDKYSSSPFQRSINPHHKHEFYHTELLQLVNDTDFKIIQIKGINEVYQGSWFKYVLKTLMLWTLPKTLLPLSSRLKLRRLKRFIQCRLLKSASFKGKEKVEVGTDFMKDVKKIKIYSNVIIKVKP